jgi:hypothetical protein
MYSYKYKGDNMLSREEKRELITFMVENPHRILQMIEDYKSYNAAAKLNLTPAQLSNYTPILKAIVKVYDVPNDPEAYIPLPSFLSDNDANNSQETR